MTSLLHVDWTTIPAPVDDGAAQHLAGLNVPAVLLPASDGRAIDLSTISGRCVVYAYPMTGKPGVPLPDGWDMLPGARGCTPQSCAFRDLAADLKRLGVAHVFGLSTQSTDDQKEAADRLHLPFALLSDDHLRLASAMRLPTFVVQGTTMLKRLTMVIDGGAVIRVFYPVFPPDQNALDVMRWIEGKQP